MEKNGCTQIIRHVNEFRKNCSLRKLLSVIYWTLSNELSVRIDETAQNKLMENLLTQKKKLLSTQVNECVVLLKRWFCLFLQFDFHRDKDFVCARLSSLFERDSLGVMCPFKFYGKHTLAAPCLRTQFKRLTLLYVTGFWPSDAVRMVYKGAHNGILSNEA